MKERALNDWCCAQKNQAQQKTHTCKKNSTESGPCVLNRKIKQTDFLSAE
jgi:hypothetical protein